jgi:hypothetical protein
MRLLRAETLFGSKPFPKLRIASVSRAIVRPGEYV